VMTAVIFTCHILAVTCFLKIVMQSLATILFFVTLMVLLFLVTLMVLLDC
jgi:hypothetical protein